MANFSEAASPALQISRLGVNNFDSVAWDNFIRLYTAECLTAYKRETVLESLVRQKTISGGKSTTFPMLGRSSVEYFTPGNEITGGKLRAGERTVLVDDLMISSKMIYSLDEAMAYYEVRGQYSEESGNALAWESDRNCARMLVKAALATDLTSAAAIVQSYKQFDEEEFVANVNIGTVSGDDLDPSAIDKAILDALKLWKKKSISSRGAVLALSTDNYFSLLDTTDSAKINWRNSLYGGVSGFSGIQVPTMHGVEILCVNNMDVSTLWNGATGVTTDQKPLAASVGSGRTEAYDIPVAYLPTALLTRGVLFTPDAVCKVNLLGVQIESEYQMRFQGTQFLAKKAEGFNVLRPASAIALMAVA